MYNYIFNSVHTRFIHICVIFESNDINYVPQKRHGGIFVGDWFQGLGI
jgi:hypothetical protein